MLHETQLLEWKAKCEDADRVWREKQTEKDRVWREKQTEKDRAWREKQSKKADRRFIIGLIFTFLAGFIVVMISSVQLLFLLETQPEQTETKNEGEG